MPLVSITMAAGRPLEVRRRLVAAVTDAVATSLDLPSERIGVHLHELDPDQMARGGKLNIDQDAARTDPRT
jgi:4-oxalocrotonate tautomerase